MKTKIMLPTEDDDDLAPARGFLNGIILSWGFFWGPVVIMFLILGGCVPDAQGVAKVTEPKTIFVTLYPDYQSLQEAYREFRPDDQREVLAFAQPSPCHIYIVAPVSHTDGKFAESFEHELRHCTDGAWHQ